MKTTYYIALLYLVLFTSLSAAEVDVRYEKKTYYLNAEFQVEASPDRVMQILTNFRDIAELNPAIIESELLKSPNKEISRVRSVVKDCVVFFCRKITRVEDIQQQGNVKLESFIVPEHSDLHSGYTIWELSENDTGSTNVKYMSDMQPKFWIPPMLRSSVVTQKFEQRVSESVQLLQNKVINDS